MFNFTEQNNMPPNPRSQYYARAPKQYGFLGFMGDLFMIVITGGLWLVWIFVREMRRR